jgi:ribosomal protein S18 acetylase RimI-like enzyme
MLKTVEPARQADLPRLVETLSLAFQEDPAVSWIFPDDQDRQKRLPRMFGLFAPGDLASGMALRSPADEVCTLWQAPNTPHLSKLAMLRLAFPLLHAFGGSTLRAMAVGDAIDAHHPSHPFWYLHYAGVRPDHQGKGWGGAAIRAGIARAQADGQPVYLETATLSNVGLYQSLGFRVTGEWDVPKGGPHFWSMLLA